MRVSLFLRWAFLLFLTEIFIVSSLYAQTSPKDNFFADYNKLIDGLRRDNAEVISPEFFKEAVKKIKEANEDYDNKESMKKVRKKLEECEEYARRAQNVIRLSKITLKEALEARDDALVAKAPLYCEKEWQKAEDKFKDAATNLEDDDMEDAREYGGEASELYRKAELLAIKNGILGEARESILLAVESNAKEYSFHTLRDAQKLLAEAEKILESNRNNKETAIKKASRSVYQGKHAQSLAKKIENLSKKKENWENLILSFEGIIIKFGDLFNYESKFEEGFDNSVTSIIAYINNLKEEQKRLLKENSELEEELNSVKEREASSSAELQKKLKFEKKIEKVKQIFTDREAKVIYEGDNLTIRLLGLTFPSGKATIQPEYFSLITKVQRAIREFPDKYILIEGHTDSMGNPRKNKDLSEQRAKAIKEYLIANMDLNIKQIEHYGLGEEKPIASNKTKGGRALNRRIDIVISIED